MKELSRYIAFLLLLIFVFPLAFQPLHFLYHHHEDHFYKHSQEGSVYLSLHHEPCPVCSYQFTTFDLLRKFSLDKRVDYIILLQLVNVKSPHIAFNGNHITLRAPPGIV